MSAGTGKRLTAENSVWNPFEERLCTLLEIHAAAETFSGAPNAVSRFGKEAGNGSSAFRLTAAKAGDEVVLTENGEGKMRYVFSEITANTFKLRKTLKSSLSAVNSNPTFPKSPTTPNEKILWSPQG
ncbi:MAG: hypothetical protein ACTTKL_02335 [Treponema sp.]